jgi:hypothetical protein
LDGIRALNLMTFALLPRGSPLSGHERWQYGSSQRL